MLTGTPIARPIGSTPEDLPPLLHQRGDLRLVGSSSVAKYTDASPQRSRSRAAAPRPPFEATQLLALFARQQIAPATAVSLRSPHLRTQGFVVDAEVARDLPNRPLRLERELTQLQPIPIARSSSIPQDGAWFGKLRGLQFLS
jgi:hypothetical protein